MRKASTFLSVQVISAKLAEWQQNNSYEELVQFWKEFEGANCIFKRLGFNKDKELFIKDLNRPETAQGEEYTFDSFERIIHSTLCSLKNESEPLEETVKKVL